MTPYGNISPHCWGFWAVQWKFYSCHTVDHHKSHLLFIMLYIEQAIYSTKNSYVKCFRYGTFSILLKLPFTYFNAVTSSSLHRTSNDLFLFSRPTSSEVHSLSKNIIKKMTKRINIVFQRLYQWIRGGHCTKYLITFDMLSMYSSSPPFLLPVEVLPIGVPTFDIMHQIS